MKTIAERFWEKVNKNGQIPKHCPELGACWEWMAGRFQKSNYGIFYYNKIGQNIGSHRYSWIMHFGEIPKDLFVLHKCDNRGCVNPNHLFIGTQQDNMDDMISKKRFPRQDGDFNNGRKLNSAQVSKIRKLILEGVKNLKQIGRLFNVSSGTIALIRDRKTWIGVD